MIIISLNVVVQILVSVFISHVGLDSVTLESSCMKNVMFWILFYNTGIVMMLVGANIPWLSNIFNGAYKDFTSKWFLVIGS